mmetsp:Transcript_21979/g.58717  ORF Transcript_21979/g.58717 Transcript_21979/m.58717 type:complete len:349 (+) Transcript_21979:472-1518(+)
MCDAPLPAPPSPSSSSASKGAAKRGVTPSCAVGKKKGALASGFGASAGLLRSFTVSKCSVACHLAGGTSDNVSNSGSSGAVLAGRSFPSDVPLPASPSSFSSSSAAFAGPSASGAPGSSTRTGSFGSGRNSGAERSGSKRNLLAQTWMALPLAWEVNRKALLGAKHKLKAGLAKTKESTHREARRSKMRRPPSRSAAASHRASPLKATSVAGTPQAKERTTEALLRSTTCRAPSSKPAAINAPWALNKMPLGQPDPALGNGTEKAASCVISFQVRSSQSLGCEAKETTSPETEISTPQMRPRCARGAAGAAFAGVPGGGAGSFGMAPRCSWDWRLKRCRAPFSSPKTQ